MKLQYWVNDSIKAMTYRDTESVIYAVNKALDIWKTIKSAEEADKFYSVIKQLRGFCNKNHLFESYWDCTSLIVNFCLVVK